MSTLDDVNDLFHKLLARFSGGIANTSTNKYNDIKTLVASELSLAPEQVYATGATTRISNLDTRLAQGNQRGQHAPLALTFLKLESREGEDSDAAIERFRASFSATCNKFVSGEERGTIFDGILGFVQLDGEQDLRPLRFIRTEDFAYKEEFDQKFPCVDEVVLKRVHGAASVSEPAPATYDASHVPPELGTLLKACESSLTAGGLRLGGGLLARYLAALLTKRFVILAGLSGSGKTKLALSVAKWMEEVEGQVEVVAVGADWTSNESVLGYRDALDPQKYRAPTSGALDLILRATKDQTRPYFLIMDEMNLSHVERYFADLLSAIESGEPVALHSADEEVDGIPARLLLPPNLFIVGTVNVDETTYMFSPKVLDRANVIEFRVSVEDMREFLDSPSMFELDKLKGQGIEYGSLFVDAAATPGVSLDSLPETIAEGTKAKADVQKALGELFEILSPIGAEFGYRTAAEIYRFVYMHALLVGAGWQVLDAIDAQVLQKVMPKLHGSERRLRPVLQKLADYVSASGLKSSHEKVARMQDRLREGFASYLD